MTGKTTKNIKNQKKKKIILNNFMNIGFIGLGVMGFPMAGHLHKSKHNVAVFNRSLNKVEKWIKDYEARHSRI